MDRLIGASGKGIAETAPPYFFWHQFCHWSGFGDGRWRWLGRTGRPGHALLSANVCTRGQTITWFSVSCQGEFLPYTAPSMSDFRWFFCLTDLKEQDNIPAIFRQLNPVVGFFFTKTAHGCRTYATGINQRYCARR